MQREGDEEAWRAIVENFGERARLDEPMPDHPADRSPDRPSDRPSDRPTDRPTDRPSDRPPETRGELPSDPQAEPPAGRSDPYEWAVADEPEDEPDPDAFVPPDPPPLPVPEPDRGIAWLGVFGAPALLLVSLLAGIGLPSWLGYVMVAWFVGGFIYLVARMPREPRDPWDDGSRL